MNGVQATIETQLKSWKFCPVNLELTHLFRPALYLDSKSPYLMLSTPSQIALVGWTTLSLSSFYLSSLTMGGPALASKGAQQRFQSPPVGQTKPASTLSPQYRVIDEARKERFTVDVRRIFTPGTLPKVPVQVQAQDLLTVLSHTRAYFDQHGAQDPDVQRLGALGTQGVTMTDVLNTLEFMISVLQEDIALQKPTRLQDPDFLNTHFKVIKWRAYHPQNPGQGQLRITKYAAFSHPGSRTKTAEFNIPIYALNNQARTDKFYLKYTKQDVLSGLYEPGGKEFGKAKPIAYLTRTGFESALLQGTVLIQFDQGSSAFFNVDRSNGIPYVKGLAGPDQKRYWYFQEVDSIRGYGYQLEATIPIKPGVTFAGDILNVGLGRMIVLEHHQGGHQQLQLGVIADTGGAFLPNLHQLDFLAGVFNSEPEFYEHIRQLPEYAQAYILIKK